MNIYPALRATQGSWVYYIVKMSARELSGSVRFAYEVYDDRTLDEAIQRVLNEGRIKKEIVEYLKRQPDRFFASIVIAALNGDPKFYPVEITDDPSFAIFRDDRRLNETFGVLKFDGTQKYYALDGQHRLAAIKTLMDRDNTLSDGAPKNFEKEEYSVIVVVPNQEDEIEGFMQKYRRLFSNLNRYAKPTDQATNIIMDEDDTFAILTRRIISEHPFFRSGGPQKKSIRVKTSKGKNLKMGDPFITSIEMLYDINTILLNSRNRKNKGWGWQSNEGDDIKSFKRFRTSEEYLEKLYEELRIYWDSILNEIPELQNDPSKMRTHEIAEVENDRDEVDHLLFWPIGQQMLAKIVRQMLDQRLPDPSNYDESLVREALKGLGQLEWRLNKPPWKYFLLIQADKGGWKIRSEERKEVERIGRRIQQWVVGLDELDEDDLSQLKSKWVNKLLPPQDDEKINKMWKYIDEIRIKITI